jgi:hypothetical protein
VYLIPAKDDVAPSFVQEEPALAAATAGAEIRVAIIVRESKTRMCFIICLE